MNKGNWLMTRKRNRINLIRSNQWINERFVVLSFIGLDCRELDVDITMSHGSTVVSLTVSTKNALHGG